MYVYFDVTKFTATRVRDLTHIRHMENVRERKKLNKVRLQNETKQNNTKTINRKNIAEFDKRRKKVVIAITTDRLVFLDLTILQNIPFNLPYHLITEVVCVCLSCQRFMITPPTLH